MNTKFFSFIALFLFLLVSSPLATAAPEEEATAVKGSTINLQFRDVPDAAVVNGEYHVDAKDGTIKLPHIDGRVYVAGLTARQVEDKLTRLYTDKEIYRHPIVTASVGEAGAEGGLKQRYVLVTGYVAGKKNLPYRQGMTLIEALLACGDITDFGSRYIQVTRDGQTRTYDYFSARDRAIKLRPSDEIYVPKRPIREGRPDKLLP